MGIYSRDEMSWVYNRVMEAIPSLLFISTPRQEHTFSIWELWGHWLVSEDAGSVSYPSLTTIRVVVFKNDTEKEATAFISMPNSEKVHESLPRFLGCS